jgi:putative peptidoglycan lipid II flippase
MRKKNPIKAMLIISVASVLGKLFGFFREVAIGAAFGTTNVADAYILTISVPGIIFANASLAIATTFIPEYMKIKNDKTKERFFVCNFLNIIFVISAVIALVSAIFAEQILSVIASGFDAETMAIAVTMSRIVFLNIAFLGVNGILAGYLQANGHFTVAAAINIPYSIVLIASLYLYDKIGIRGISVAVLIGIILQTATLLISAFTIGFKYKFSLNFKDKSIKTIALLSIPVFFTGTAAELNAVIDRILASGLPRGSVAALSYANKLNFFLAGMISFSLSAALYPTLSEASAANDMALFKSVLRRSLDVITIMLFPIAVAMLIMHDSVVTAVFERGAFDASSTALTSSALFFYAFGMAFYAYRDMLSKAFYSIQDTKTPTIITVAAILVNIALNIILSKFMLHNGLALAAAIVAVLASAALLICLAKKIGGFGASKLLPVAAKSAGASAIMGIVVFVLHKGLASYFSSGKILLQIFAFAVTAVIGAGLYFGVMLLLKVKEITWMIELAKSKLPFRRTIN